jgi:hypothetical protein
MAEAAVLRQMFREILSLIGRRPRQRDRQMGSDMILDLIDHDSRGAP